MFVHCHSRARGTDTRTALYCMAELMTVMTLMIARNRKARAAVAHGERGSRTVKMSAWSTAGSKYQKTQQWQISRHLKCSGAELLSCTTDSVTDTTTPGTYICQWDDVFMCVRVSLTRTCCSNIPACEDRAHTYVVLQSHHVAPRPHQPWNRGGSPLL